MVKPSKVFVEIANRHLPKIFVVLLLAGGWRRDDDGENPKRPGRLWLQEGVIAGGCGAMAAASVPVGWWQIIGVGGIAFGSKADIIARLRALLGAEVAEV